MSPPWHTARCKSPPGEALGSPSLERILTALDKTMENILQGTIPWVEGMSSQVFSISDFQDFCGSDINPQNSNISLGQDNTKSVCLILHPARSRCAIPRLYESFLDAIYHPQSKSRDESSTEG